MNHFDESETVTDFKKQAQKTTDALNRIDIESFKPTRKFQANGSKLPPARKEWRRWHQTGQGISTAIALAGKLGVTPWEVIEK